MKRKNAANNFGVSIKAIEVSLTTAFIHVIFELINLYLESSTSQTSFADYMVACYNARQGWIPQQEDFSIDQLALKEQQEVEKVEELGEDSISMFADSVNTTTTKHETKVIEFDNKNKKFCGYFGFSVQFELSNNSIDYLYQIISNMPVIEEQDKSKMKKLKLGVCIQNVDIMKIIQLLKVAYKKIEIEFEDEILRKIMANDEDFLNWIQCPQFDDDDGTKKEEHLIIEMVQKNYTQFVRLMIEQGARIDIESRKPIRFGKENQATVATVFKIAYENRN